MGEHTIIYQPQIIRETAEGLNRLDIRDEMLGRRELELMTPVDAESCATVIRGLLYLQHQDPEAPVTLYINSPGGEVQNGLALYDVMRAVSCTIRTVCLGVAASMAALLFIAADEREVLPHSRIMIHGPLITVGTMLGLGVGSIAGGRSGALIGAGAGGSALSVKARATTSCASATSRPALSRAIAACRSSASSSSRHPIPTLRRRKPWRQALRAASSRGSSAARSVSPPSTGANASRRKRETHD